MFSEVLRSRVGREIFALSSLIAAVPILAVGALSLVEVNRSFADRTNEYLDETARAYGGIVYERLLLALELVRQSAASNRDVTNHPSALLESVEFIDRADTVRAEKPTLLIDTSDSPARIRIRHVTGGRNVVGLVSPDYLWGDPEDYPYSIDFCVLASGAEQPVYCSQAIPGETWRTIRDARAVTGILTWKSSGAPMSSAYWELFTQSSFDGPVLRFVATQPEEIALGPWKAFKALYAPALLLTIGIVLFAASVHVRRTLRPLNALVAATSRIAKGDFTVRADLGRKDEFADLANSMNDMAAGLSRQFDTLRMLAQIDQLILSGGSVEQVVERILRRISEIIPCRAAGITLADRESPDVAVSHVIGPDRGQIAVERLSLAEGVLWKLQKHPEGSAVGAPGSNVLCQALTAHDVDTAMLYPLAARDRVVGAMAIGFKGEMSLDTAQQRSVIDFTDRLAVALEAGEREAELLRRAYFDELTKLPNRQLLLDRLEQALIQARNASERLLVLFVDLDRFKAVNDSFGHTAGDGLLREAAARLRACVGEFMTVARLGGDEFVVLLPRPAGSQYEPIAVIDRLQAELSRPFLIGSSEVYLSASVGIAAFPDDGETAGELLRKSDSAMYGAKDAGRGQAFFYSADMTRRVRHKLDTEAQLRHALDRQEFRLAFQPQICLRTDRVVAAEALLRWKHSERGMVSPLEFIPIAEESGYITVLGAWAMFQACEQLSRWRGSGVLLEKIAVNVSARQFRQAGFAALVEDCLKRTGLPAQFLQLELTESTFVNDLQSARQVFAQLKEIGVSIAIDDFGTGFSSLGYLKQLSFDEIKIDRAFIKDVPDDRDGNAIVNAVVAMSHTLGKPVIAEGIETPRQLDHLKSVGVDFGQGFLLGKAVFAEEFPLESGASASGVGSMRGKMT